MKVHLPVAIVYAAGLLQGLALVTFPAASSVFTSPHAYSLSNAEYGTLFAPQTVMAVAASLLGGKLAARWSQKGVLILGLAGNLGSMALLLASRLALGTHAAAFALLLAATALMGVGFGLTVPALNSLATSLFPHRVDAAVLALNALLGLGTALAPALVALFVSLGLWWGLPLGVGALLAALVVGSLCTPFPASGAERAARVVLSARFWLFAVFALLYGVVETMNGTWAILYMKDVLQASVGVAAFALTLFWAATTAGRVLFASVERCLPVPKYTAPASLGGWSGVRCHGSGAVPLALAGGGLLCARWLRLLGTAPPYHQPRRSRRASRQADRHLPDWVWLGCVRNRSAARARGPGLARGLRRRGRTRARAGCTVGMDHPQQNDRDRAPTMRPRSPSVVSGIVLASSLDA